MAPFSMAANAILCSLLPFIALLKLTSAANPYSLFHNQTIAFGQTLVSKNQAFELGFFQPGSSTSRKNVFLGIWYKTTPDVVVWVANRNNPITDPQGVLFSLAKNGSIAIRRGGRGRVIWSANPSTPASRPSLRLLDTGNLVVSDEATAEEEEKGYYLWQSFDFPTDTWLSGMKIVDDNDSDVSINLTSWRNWDDPSPGDFIAKIHNQGLGELVIFKGTAKMYRNGKWNGLYFNGFPRFRNTPPKAKLIFKEERLISILMLNHFSVMERATLDVSGSFHHCFMNPRKDKWKHAYTLPQDQCDGYGTCGPNGICTVEKAQRCECLRGFSPIFQNDWNHRDWSAGCGRIRALNCQSGDGFVEVRGVKYPDMLRLKFWLNTSMSLDECKAECLRNCRCTAFANPYVNDGGSGCLMWYGDLVDTRELPAAHDMQKIYIRVPLSELGKQEGEDLHSRVDVSSNLEEKEKKKAPINSILISIATGVVVSCSINGVLVLRARWKKRAVKRRNEDIELPLIKMATILEATNNFSNEKVIGIGGFGSVYKGILSAGGEEVAVKRLSKGSGQGLEEFKNEVILISKLQHRNLVKLLGCCIEGEEMVLIYEYQQNTSLDRFVFDPDGRTLLTWPKRLNIIMGIARGLLYLHHDSRLKIIHRDLKTSNILLDASLNPKISDFGLARTFEEDQTISRTKRVVGTYGYMAPEYAFHGKFSVKSDIYSLGVVLLEIISGKRIQRFEHKDNSQSLLGHAWLAWKEKRIMEVMDKGLKETFVESQVKRCIHVGLLCVQKVAEDRPIMPSVVLMLATEGAFLPNPKEPGYFMEGSYTSLSIKSDTLTITDVEGR